ncbi:MAG: PH domain-containing protein [Filimonas sp.]|nr:PH domain-containing protein [Filimonas sp.]
MTVYRSKIGFSIFIPTVVVLITVMGFAIYNSVWLSVTIVSLATIFILYTFLNTYYVIDGDKLKIRCGIFRSTVNIASIKLIKKSNSILSAPAASLDRILIRYNKYDTLVISPKHKEQFAEHLQKLNPQIEIKLS